MQRDVPDDFVLATGEAHSVREFVDLAFREVGIDIAWEGTGIEERGIDRKTGQTRVRVDARYFRPTEVDFLLGDPSKARRLLGWEHRISFEELVREMVQVDLALGKTDHSVVGPKGVTRRLSEVTD